MQETQVQSLVWEDPLEKDKIKTSGETVLQTVRETALKVQREIRVAEIENSSPKVVMLWLNRKICSIKLEEYVMGMIVL